MVDTEAAVLLARLAAKSDDDGGAFLLPHHVLAATRLGQLIEWSRITPRVTMSYDAARVGGGRGGNQVAEASDGAASARAKVNQVAAALPSDCWGVVFDVCGLGKGLQVIETERRWPRRSAKLVLRIGLEQLASHFGLSADAVGRERGRQTGWLEERLPLIVPETTHS